MDTRRPPLWWEVPLSLLTFLACEALSRAAWGDKQAAAQVNARQVLALESAVGLDVEEAANRAFAAQRWLAVIAGYHYAALYVLTSIAVLVFLYLRDPLMYRWARRSALLLNLLAAVCFFAYPVAPPRLNPRLTIVDTVAAQHIWGTWGSPVGDAANQLAALPSLHFAWVLWVLVMLIVATRSVVLIALAALDVVLTAVVVVGTGNHYPLDLVAGAVVVAVSIPATRPWSEAARRRFAERLGTAGRFLLRHAILVQGGVTARERRHR